jgi:CHASE3 domain sensor protein
MPQKQRPFRILLFTGLAIAVILLVLIAATLEARKTENNQYSQTVHGFETSPAVATALAGTLTAKAWTVTPSVTVTPTLSLLR